MSRKNDMVLTSEGNLDDLSMSKGLEKLVARNLDLLHVRDSREDSLEGRSMKPKVIEQRK